MTEKSKVFRVEADTGNAFIATADLLGMNKNDLLGEMMKYYVKSVKRRIVDVAAKYPQFEMKYPFIACDGQH